MTTTSPHRPRPWVLLLAALAVLAAVAAWAVPALAKPPGAGSDGTPPDTIVAIEGDRANGFTIRRHDRSEMSPPTDSEARAECSEYETRMQRVRCYVEVRTWYDALTEHQKSLRWLGGP